MGKGLLGPKGGSCGGIGGRGGSITGKGGGWLAKRSIVLNDGRGGGRLVVLDGKSLRESKNGCGEVGGVEKISSTGSKFMANGEDCLDGCDGAGGEKSKVVELNWEWSIVCLVEIGGKSIFRRGRTGGRGNAHRGESVFLENQRSPRPAPLPSPSPHHAALAPARPHPTPTRLFCLDRTGLRMICESGYNMVSTPVPLRYHSPNGVALIYAMCVLFYTLQDAGICIALIGHLCFGLCFRRLILDVFFGHYVEFPSEL
ncbi:hypothetical protein Tco_1146449 [Tanacetum coccineum]